jgi:hypothetical protein
VITPRDVIAAAGGIALGAAAMLLLQARPVARPEDAASSGPRASASASGDEARLAEGSARRRSTAPLGSEAVDGGTSDENADVRDELLSHVRDLERRLAGVEEKKNDLERQLGDARGKLAAVEDGGKPRMRDEYDLTKEDWVELAKTGTIKYCIPGGRLPDQEMLDALGLAPGDRDAIKTAYERSQKRLWSKVKPLCAAAIGSDDLAETIGFGTCRHVVLGVAQKRDGKASSDAMRGAAEIRAGLRPMPAPGTPLHPTLDLFLTLTGETANVEADLAESLGPEDAHRIAVARELCGYTSTHGGGSSSRSKSGPLQK